jgi:hypothetical protein
MRQDQRLLPRGLRILFYCIWPALLVAQWAIVALLSWFAGVWSSLPGQFPEHTRTVPFLQDFFFWAWNLFPFGFAFSIWLADRNVRTLIAIGLPRSTSEEGLALVRRTVQNWVALALSRRVLLLASVVAVAGIVLQYVKIANWERTLDRVYWWQTQFSAPVFYVRLVTLFLDLLILVVGFVCLLGLLVGLGQLAKSRLWNLDLVHPDGGGGLVPFGITALTFTVLPFLASMVGLLGYFDHCGAASMQTIADMAFVLLASLFCLLAFLLPVWPIHVAMRDEKHARCPTLGQTLKGIGPPPTDDESRDIDQTCQAVHDWQERHEPIASLHARLVSASTWPFSLGVLLRAIGVVMGPIVILLLDKVLSLPLRP